MGGHGGLNILPQKRWHVYRDDNRLRVLRDEREFQEALQAEREQQQRRVMNDVVTCLKRRKIGVSGESPGSDSAHGSVLALSALGRSERLEQPKSEAKLEGFGNGNVRAAQGQNPQGRQLMTARETLSIVTPPTAAQITNSSGQRYRSTSKRQQQTAAEPMNAGFANEAEAPVMARQLNLTTGRVDALGRQSDGHFNFFAAAEREVTKQQKARERYLLQAGHSSSRQSEFSGIAKELNNVWYQSEMPSNRIAREERQDARLPAKLCSSVEAAAEEARRRMLAVQLRKPREDQPSKSSAKAAEVDRKGADCRSSDAESVDSDVCIVKECFVGSRGPSGIVTKDSKPKKAPTTSDSLRISRKERKLLKRMKRKWMLDALDLQARAGATGRLEPRP